MSADARAPALFALGGAGLHLLYFLHGGLGYLWARVTPGRGMLAS